MHPERPSLRLGPALLVGAVLVLALGIVVGRTLAQPRSDESIKASATATPGTPSTVATTGPPDTTTTSLTTTSVVTVTTIATSTTKPAPRPTAPAATAPATTIPARLNANGVFQVGIVLSEALAPLPTDCSGFNTSWQIQVRDGASSVVALGVIKGSTMTDRSLTNGVLSMTCRFNYSVTLSRGPIFTFQVVHSGDNRQIDGSITVSGDSLGTGQAPLLTATFCPECRK